MILVELGMNTELIDILGYEKDIFFLHQEYLIENKTIAKINKTTKYIILLT